MVSHASADFSIIDAFRLPLSLIDINGHREKAMMQDQKRTNHPKLSISNIMASSSAVKQVDSCKARHTN